MDDPSWIMDHGSLQSMLENSVSRIFAISNAVEKSGKRYFAVWFDQRFEP